jgi:hypothetical protein
MKLTNLTFIGAVASQAPELRKVKNLLDMMVSIWPDFSPEVSFAYGCNCQFDEAPLGHPGFGAPLDAIDHTCKEYRSCHKCLEETYDGTCDPAEVRYGFDI